MALVGGPTYYTYGHNHWQTRFAAAPPSLATRGVPLPDGTRLIVELGVISPDSWSDSPALNWVDITSYVTNIAFATGDTSGRVSRWPLEQATITTKDLTDLVGDFVELPPLQYNRGPCPGSFLRWGVTDGVSWRPRQSLIVESIRELISGRVRGWQIECYGTLLYWAPTIFATDSATTAIATALSVTCSEFTGEGQDNPWPWAEAFAAQNPNFPTTLTAAFNTMGNFGGANIYNGKLALMHRLADSQGMRLYNDPSGGLFTEEWTTTVASTVRVADETTIDKPGHDLVAGTVTADFQWIRSQDRADTRPGVKVDLYLFVKWYNRHISYTFPTDLMCTPTSPQNTALANAWASLGTSELRLDRFSIDTARDVAAWALLTAAAPVWTRSTPTVERRRPKVEWLQTTVFVNAVAGIIDFATGIGRARIDYHTRLIQ